MDNIGSIKESRWPQTLFKHLIACKAIVGHTSETTVNCEPKPDCQYHLSSFLPSVQNTHQQCIGILRETY